MHQSAKATAIVLPHDADALQIPFRIISSVNNAPDRQTLQSC